MTNGPTIWQLTSYSVATGKPGAWRTQPCNTLPLKKSLEKFTRNLSKAQSFSALVLFAVASMFLLNDEHCKSQSNGLKKLPNEGKGLNVIDMLTGRKEPLGPTLKIDTSTTGHTAVYEITSN